MKKKMKKRINETLKAKARELASKEGRGYIEAEWLQTQDIELGNNIIKYIEDAEEKGYHSEDITVRADTSTHHAWYTWLAVRVQHPLLGGTDRDRVVFPERSNHAKAFVMPLYEKELAEEKNREKIKLEESLKQARARVTELHKELDTAIEAKLHEIVDDSEFELDDVTYTVKVSWE